MAASLVALSAQAVDTRPDREDAEYQELATRYPASIALGASAGEAALVAPRWLLTSAKAAEKVRPARVALVGNASHEIQSVFTDPRNAVALIFLRTPVEGVEPAPLHREADEAGKTVAIVGHGRGAARAAINTIDRATPTTLELKLKSLDEASDLQGALTSGETGAPLYIEVRDVPTLAGIAIDTGREWQAFARVSSLASWIDQTMFTAAVAEAKSGTDPRVGR